MVLPKKENILTARYSIWQIFFMNLSVCVGLGIFIISTGVHSQLNYGGIGSMVPWAFLLGAVPALATALLTGVCSSLWPSCGGDYTYYKKKIPPLLAYLVTWTYWIALPFQLQGSGLTTGELIANSLEILGYGRMANVIQTYLIPLSLVFIAIGFLINFFRWEGFIAPITVIITFLLGALFVYFTISHNARDFQIVMGITELNRYGNNLPSPNILGFIMGTSILMFGFGGITFGQNAGEECKGNFSRGICRAIVSGTIVVAILYVIISFSLYKAVPWKYIAQQARMNPGFSAINAVAVYIPKKSLALMNIFLAIVVLDNMFILGFRGARHSLAFARDGIFPSFLKKIKLGGPVYNVVLLYGLAILILFFLHLAPLGFLANYSYSLGLIFTGIIGLKLTDIEIKKINHNTKLWKPLVKICGIIAVVFYSVNLLGLAISIPKMTLVWVILGLPGIVTFSLRNKKIISWRKVTQLDKKIALSFKSNLWEEAGVVAANLNITKLRVKAVLLKLFIQKLIFPVIYVNWNKINIRVYPIVLKFKGNVADREKDEFLTILAKFRNTLYVYEAEGNFDASAAFISSGQISELDEFKIVKKNSLVSEMKIMELEIVFKEAGRFDVDQKWGDVEYYFYMEDGKMITGMIHPDINKEKDDLYGVGVKKSRYELDDVDRMLISALPRNPIIFSLLARKLGMNKNEVKRRLCRLSGERIIIPTLKFRDEKSTHWYQIYLAGGNVHQEKVYNNLLSNPFFCAAGKLNGTYQMALGAHVEAENVDYFHKIIDKEIMGKMANDSSTEILHVKWIYKFNNVFLGRKESKMIPVQFFPWDANLE